jgi:hypothetical protein
VGRGHRVDVSTDEAARELRPAPESPKFMQLDNKALFPWIDSESVVARRRGVNDVLQSRSCTMHDRLGSREVQKLAKSEDGTAKAKLERKRRPE